MKILLVTLSSMLVSYSPLSQSLVPDINLVEKNISEINLDSGPIKNSDNLGVINDDPSSFFIEKFNVEVEINEMFNIIPEDVNLFDGFQYFHTCIGVPCMTANARLINIIAQNQSFWFVKCKRCQREESDHDNNNLGDKGSGHDNPIEGGNENGERKRRLMSA